jgi:hypothetical protein
MMKNSYLQE